jgi:hypothetical protein
MLLEDCDVVARDPRVLYVPGTKTFTSSRGFFQENAEKTGMEPFVGRTLVNGFPEEKPFAHHLCAEPVGVAAEGD